jgi:hypothetical protein
VRNRVIVYSGCFNPPHLGHLELITHVFLRSDENTIGAILVPVGELQYGKHGEKTGNGGLYALNKKDKITLLQNGILQRFAWSYPYPRRDLLAFEEKMVVLAKMDGFELAFVALSGSDHCEDVFNTRHCVQPALL